MLPTDKQARKERPIARGVLDYFPDAIAAVAHVSYVGNQQHNPGQPLHWSREKSTDHADCVARHLLERGTIDDDGMPHSAKAAWRMLALLQIELENRPEPLDIVDDRSPVELDTMNFGVPANPSDFYSEAPSDDVAGEDPETVRLGEWIAGLPPLLTDQSIGQPVMDEDADEDFADAASEKRSELAYIIDDLGCQPEVADQIAKGTTLCPFANAGRYIYIAGPMRGYTDYNFAAFDVARDAALSRGWNVISPADIDRAAGDEQSDDQKTFCYRDFYALYFLAHTEGGAIAMLPGWESSTGAAAEFFLARWLGLKILDARTGKTLSRDVIQWAKLVKTVGEFLGTQYADEQQKEHQ